MLLNQKEYFLTAVILYQALDGGFKDAGNVDAVLLQERKQDVSAGPGKSSDKTDRARGSIIFAQYPVDEILEILPYQSGNIWIVLMRQDEWSKTSKISGRGRGAVNALNNRGIR